jgi:hypothetical protein
MANGELMLEKPILMGAIVVLPENVWQFDRTHYPRFYDGDNVRKFCVPIQQNYHLTTAQFLNLTGEPLSSAAWWSDVRRGTMDEGVRMSA